MDRRGQGVGAATAVSLATGMAVFGTGTPTSKLVGQDFPAFVGSGLRCALGAAVLVPAMAIARRRTGETAVPRMSRGDVAVLAGIGLFGMFGFTLLMLYGMREVSGAVGSVAMATTPAVTALGAVVFLGDRLGRLRALGVGLAVAGVLVVNLGGGVGGSEGGILWLGTLLVIGAVCGEAAYTLLGKRLTADLTPLEVSALASAAGAVLFVPGAAWQWSGTQWGGVSAGDWAALAWWGLGTLAAGSLLWYTGVRRVPGSVAAGFMGLMPVSALATSYVLLGESFRWIHVAGMTLALAGMWAASRSGDDAGGGETPDSRGTDAGRRDAACA